MSRALAALTQAATHARTTEGTPGLPRLTHTADLDAATLSLQRMVDAFNQQRAQLEALNAMLDNNVKERTREIKTLVDVSRRLTTNFEARALMKDLLEVMKEAVDFQTASIWSREDGHVVLSSYHMPQEQTLDEQLEGTRLPGTYARLYGLMEGRRQSVVKNNSRRSFWSYLVAQLTEGRAGRLFQSARSWMATPLLAKEDMIGVLRLDSVTPDYFTPERERLIEAIGNQAALAIDHARLYEQAEQAAVMAERTRIARDLHDAVSQTLFAVNMTADSMQKQLDRDPEAARASLLELQQLSRGALAEMRVLLFELRPDAMRVADLEHLLTHLTNAMRGRLGIDIALDVAGPVNPPPQVKTQLYRIAQEALNNVTKHSGATMVRVALAANGPACVLAVRDNGAGFDMTRQTDGLGLRSMRERAAEIMAVITVASAPGEGTEVKVAWQPEEQQVTA
jgi:signal transduction histidine kinase